MTIMCPSCPQAAVSGVAGLVGGMVVKKTSGMLLNTCLTGAIGIAGACYFGVVKPEQIAARAEKVADTGASWFGGGETTVKDLTDINKTKMILSKIYKKAPGVVAGLAGGSLLGYYLG